MTRAKVGTTNLDNWREQLRLAQFNCKQDGHVIEPGQEGCSRCKLAVELAEVGDRWKVIHNGTVVVCVKPAQLFAALRCAGNGNGRT